MTITRKKLTAAVEAYFADLGRVYASGGATRERSSYGPLNGLLGAVGAMLRPKVHAVQEPSDLGAGHPDFALYPARQMQRGRVREGQPPERGVVEVKPLDHDAVRTASGDQVARYASRYHLVLVTNGRDFVLVGGDGTRLETLRLAEDAEAFRRCMETPRAFARKTGSSLGEYLVRALSRRAVLAEPKDLAWLLASHARDGLARIEAAGDAPSLVAVREALEAALDIRFEGKPGMRFFHSTLVQALFYGVFSAWVLWARQTPELLGKFDWRTAVWHLRVPALRALFQQISDPGRLQPLGLVEVLDWAAGALDRVDRAAFFARFREGEAVPYFYEPFLEAFDPTLRKQLGVWYTPPEVVRYMVARIDRALKDDLGIAEGLAAEHVHVLDPCCGTGAYLAEVLRRIAANLEGQGLGALVGARVRQAATRRVHGFEIMPAPFVIAHLQVGLTMEELDAPLAGDGSERPSVLLTNALTGWEMREHRKLPIPELEEERDRADGVKQKTPVLAILGNPPYNGFAGMAVDEERQLSEAYRATRRVRRPEGQGLNDLYVRFFRMAERRIAEKTGEGIVCFISNYSWLDGLSFTGMRERYLDVFDVIRIDCLNGDKYRTGKTAPDGSPDPSIFSTEADPVGIQVGTAIATLVRKPKHAASGPIGFRDLWGTAKRAELVATVDDESRSPYRKVEPVLPLGLPFAPVKASAEWFAWPSLPELFPVSYPGIKTSRDGFLVDVDRDRLMDRVREYFDPRLSHGEVARRYGRVMESTARFDARAVRDALLRRGGPDEDGFIPFAYRPFDIRWLYWERETKLLDEKRADYRPHAFEGNRWFSAAQHLRQGASEPQAVFTSRIGSLHLIERGSNMFPARLRAMGSDAANPNLSAAARRYLERLGLDPEVLFHHVLAVMHDPGWLKANSGALRMEWPRIPLPGWPDGGSGNAAGELGQSAAQGREIAALLDPEPPVPGVTAPPLRPELAAIAVPATVGGRHMAGDDFSVTAGWGRFGPDDAVMPGRGRVAEHEAPPGLLVPGDTTFDVYLNRQAFWRNVPAAVWNYRLGGYQVLKKWLSYRERSVLGRSLRAEEAQYFSDTARRIAAILILVASFGDRYAKPTG